MRVPDVLLESVAFIERETYRDAEGRVFSEPIGTGFFGISAGYRFLVTAKHVARALGSKNAVIRVNKKGGGTVQIVDVSTQWFTHPSDSACDVAIAPLNDAPDASIRYVPLDLFVTPGNIEHWNIGVGDEVFMIGLFSLATGTDDQITPIVRHGNVAMVPRQQIQIGSGEYADAYLIEARSIGGLSGSPVFVRETVYIANVQPDGKIKPIHALGELRLLGLALGHWDVDPTRRNEIQISASDHGVNLGIAIVVPAHKILETFQHPAIQAFIAENEAHLRAQSSPHLD